MRGGSCKLNKKDSRAVGWFVLLSKGSHLSVFDSSSSCSWRRDSTVEGFRNTEERWKWREGKKANMCIQRTIHPCSIWKFRHFSLFVISLQRVNLIHYYAITVKQQLFQNFRFTIHLNVPHANRGGMYHGMKGKLQPNPVTGYIKEDRGDPC